MNDTTKEARPETPEQNSEQKKEVGTEPKATATEQHTPSGTQPEAKAQKTSATGKYPDAVPGTTVRVSQKIQEGEKERIQVFEGVVLTRKWRSSAGATITVRKISNSIGVERIFPLHLPTITNIEIVKKTKVRRAKLGYLRSPKARKLKEVR